MKWGLESGKLNGTKETSTNDNNYTTQQTQQSQTKELKLLNGNCDKISYNSK